MERLSNFFRPARPTSGNIITNSCCVYKHSLNPQTFTLWIAGDSKVTKCGWILDSAQMNAYEMFPFDGMGQI